jgi:glutamate-1-semialdehyde 2,1-aminomutase
MTLTRTRTQELFQRAKQSMPYGVTSNFRYWGEERTNVFIRGEKGYVYDADENRFIDYRLAYGPIILGHNYPKVTNRVTQAIQNGTVYAGTHPLEITVAERIKRMTGVQKVRFANSGTEATMAALRIARAHTNREKFIKFEGTYHGMYDYVLFSSTLTQARSMGSRRSPIPIPSSSGIPQGIAQYVITLPYNDLDILEKTVKAKWGDIAAIMVEPCMGNNASVMPVPGFLELMRQLCDEYGIVLIIDEVKTGFRIANGGAQEYWGVKADLATYAKSLGNGFPIAAIGGTDEVMSVIEPGRVGVGGTFCGNVVGTAAADATLEELETKPVLKTIGARGQRLMTGLGKVLYEADRKSVV